MRTLREPGDAGPAPSSIDHGPALEQHSTTAAIPVFRFDLPPPRRRPVAGCQPHHPGDVHFGEYRRTVRGEVRHLPFRRVDANGALSVDLDIGGSGLQAGLDTLLGAGASGDVNRRSIPGHMGHLAIPGAYILCSGARIHIYITNANKAQRATMQYNAMLLSLAAQQVFSKHPKARDTKYEGYKEYHPTSHVESES